MVNKMQIYHHLQIDEDGDIDFNFRVFKKINYDYVTKGCFPHITDNCSKPKIYKFLFMNL